MAQEISKSGDASRFKNTFTPAPPPVIKQTAAPAAKSGGKRSRKIALLLTAVILLLAALGALYWLGILDPVLITLGVIPDEATLSMEQQQAVLDQRETGLDTREKELTELQAALDKRADELARREESVAAREQAQVSFSEVMAGIGDERLEALKKVGTICGQMTPESAAKVVQQLYSVDEMALVVYYMEQEQAAKLTAMLPEALAAEIFSLMMK